ncbi:MAG TPA: GTP cyclohydrolase FolE2 [Candidatus Syntrophosphaera thermopropionivorans]|nr:GTP cyclohydrolase FolE2 [Candidatus Syntrophosphaera thermopropionivorans]
MSIPDIQSQDDFRQIAIEKVGVKGLSYPIVVDDRENGTQDTVGNINLYVDLHPRRRGIHMSRFIEVLNRYHHDSIIGNLESLLQDLKYIMKAEAAYIDISFPYFIKKLAPISKIPSLMNYQCFFNASFNNAFQFWIGTTVPVTTLCPCSRAISTNGAHNQRALVTIKVRYTEFVWLEELIQIAEASASSPVYPLLKRRDEKYVTENAYANPKFVEDIVREVTQKLEKDPRIIEFIIEVESMESIHNHNAYAMTHRLKH